MRHAGLFEPVEVALQAGDDPGVAGDLPVPAAGFGVVTQRLLVGELGLQRREELDVGGVVVALLADVA